MVTASIVTYFTPIDELTRCFDSLANSCVSKIYIVDNSQQKYIEEFATNHNLEYISLPNPGFGAAHNAAIEKALQIGADYHLVLNSDIYFNPDIIARAVEYMDKNPDVGATHPMVYNPDGTRQFTARMLPTPFDVFARRFLPASWISKRNERYTLQRLNASKPINIPYFQGSFILLRLEAIKIAGMFDTRFFMYPEDIDLTRRINTYYKTMLLPQISIVHDHRAQSYKSIRMTWIHIVNMCKYFNKWGWFYDPQRRKVNKTLLREVL